MTNYFILYNIVSILAGMSALVLFFIIYKKFHTKILKKYLIFLIFFTILVFLTIMCNSLLAPLFQIEAHLMNFLLYFIWYPFLITAGTLFIHELTDKPWLTIEKAAMILVDSLFLIMLVAPFVNIIPGHDIFWMLKVEFNFIGSAVIVVYMVYFLLFILMNLKRIKLEFSAKVLKVGIILMLIFLFGLVDESNLFYIQPKMHSLPTGVYFYIFYYLIWNGMSIVMLISFFLGKPNLIPDLKEAMPDTFIRQFDITDREREIVEKLLRGYSYNAIAKELFISYQTVKTHVYNIYQKLGVSNKIELARLISDNR